MTYFDFYIKYIRILKTIVMLTISFEKLKVLWYYYSKIQKMYVISFYPWQNLVCHLLRHGKLVTHPVMPLSLLSFINTWRYYVICYIRFSHSTFSSRVTSERTVGNRIYCLNSKTWPLSKSMITCNGIEILHRMGKDYVFTILDYFP